MKLAITIANNISLDMGLRYIVLSPDRDDLKIKYKNVGFEELNSEWIYLKLK